MASNLLDTRDLVSRAPDPALAATLLAQIRFADAARAMESLSRIAGEGESRAIFADCFATLLLALSETASSDQALVNFERFVGCVPDRVTLFRYLRSHPRAIEILIRIFVESQFLTEIMLRNPPYLERLTQHKRLSEVKSVEQLCTEAEAAMLGARTTDEQLNALRRFQRWEMLRIGTCDYFGLLDLRRVTVQLSQLAESLVRTCFHIASGSAERTPTGLAVIALGKLGGEELNYSSDIDLLLVADANSASYWRTAQRMIKSLTSATADGFLYRVDMRLRPWGRSGELVSALESHITYLTQHAELWEKQALLKARVIAGDFEVGRRLLAQIQPLILGTPGAAVRASVRGMKQRIEAELEKKGRLWGEVKLGEGSIRDVEFLVQYLQLVHGKTHPNVLCHNTLEALVRLTDAEYLSADEYRILTDGYVFLRTIEHSLQLMHNKQTHELPTDPGELLYLGRRLDFPTADAFVRYYQRNCDTVREVYERFLGDEKKRVSTAGDGAALGTAGEPQPPEIRQHLERMAQSYSEAFSEPAIEHHAALAEQIADDKLVIVEAVPQESGDWTVTIVGYDYLGELSLICGLLLVHGFNIMDGQVFTYEPLATPAEPHATSPRRGWRRRPQGPRVEDEGGSAAKRDVRQKIVDVFTVRPARGMVPRDVWGKYADDLSCLLKQLHAGQRDEAQGALLKRVAASLLQSAEASVSTLYPIEIEIDNMVSEHYTVLTIQARDTIGFLYELTNALALNGIYISRVRIASERDDVFDLLYVTDAHGRKIVEPEKQRELRAATVLIKRFTHLLPHSPNPEGALLHFREFVAQLFTRPDWPDELASLERSEVLDALARLLGMSDFLWSDFLRMQHENLFPVVRNVDALVTTKTQADLSVELAGCLRTATDRETRRASLNAFKDREMFRIDMRHILGHITDFNKFSAELSDVVEVVVDAACRLCEDELRAVYGEPLLESGAPSLLCVCSLGKCGGREVGFASDIELMFIYTGEGKTNGPQVIASSQFYVKLVESVLHAIYARREGIFEIDLRLRPYGRAGSMAVSLDAFKTYFAPDGPAWPFERQALVKLRPIAGDLDVGAHVVRLRDEMIYTGEPFDVPAMRAMRERQFRQLVTPDTFNAKLSPGGLVDIEYLVQGLQITHGATSRKLRATNTLDAMSALVDAGIFTGDDYNRLREAFLFLRRLIAALRMVRGNARDLTLPPADSEEFAFLARRLGYDLRYENDIGSLPDDLARHTAHVQELSQAMLG